MKTLKATFVIVKQFGDHLNFFEDYVSFNKLELDLKCEALNKEVNDKFKNSKKTILLPYIPTVIYLVLNLEEAIEKFGDDVADYYSPDDESR